MSALFIDSSQVGYSRIGAISLDRTVIRVVTGKSEVVVRSMLQQAKNMHLKKELEGILVVSGPGSFSAIRAGVLTANLLSRIYRVPLMSLLRDEALNERELCGRVLSAVHQNMVLPIYDTAPNIS